MWSKCHSQHIFQAITNFDLTSGHSLIASDEPYFPLCLRNVYPFKFWWRMENFSFFLKVMLSTSTFFLMFLIRCLSSKRRPRWTWVHFLTSDLLDDIWNVFVLKGDDYVCFSNPVSRISQLERNRDTHFLGKVWTFLFLVMEIFLKYVDATLQQTLSCTLYTLLK